MLRKIISILLMVSFIGMASSGFLMLFINKSIAFQLKMHPVHNIFGIVMIISGVIHLYLNFGPIKKYLTKKVGLIVGLIGLMLLIFLYNVGLNRVLDPKIMTQLDEIVQKMEHSSEK